MPLELIGLGAVGLIAMDAWALVAILGSGERRGVRMLWTALVIGVPLAGFVAWLMAGPRERAYRL
ncbi:MAG: PLDc N-terminal domain-containing protein [Thermohalobaculum sp.]|nr:PLDc N-terminal domain-containing protein [Thermohalobaculum sp.]